MADELRSEVVRIPDQEALAMLNALATKDIRPAGKELAFLIRQEYGRRFSQPMTVSDLSEWKPEQL